MGVAQAVTTQAPATGLTGSLNLWYGRSVVQMKPTRNARFRVARTATFLAIPFARGALDNNSPLCPQPIRSLPMGGLTA